MHKKKGIWFWVLAFILMSLTLGFRVVGDRVWPIDENSPTLWIRICDGEAGATFTGDDLPDNDPAKNLTLDVRTMIQNILDIDFNGLQSSYLNLELYPLDPNNPPAGSTFTVANSAGRIIDFCFRGEDDGGGASPEWNDDVMTTCEFDLGQKYKRSISDFITLFSHELGHCLGINHPQETVYSVLSYHGKPDPNPRLKIDDRMALTFLYPATATDTSHDEKANFGLSCDFK